MNKPVQFDTGSAKLSLRHEFLLKSSDLTICMGLQSYFVDGKMFHSFI